MSKGHSLLSWEDLKVRGILLSRPTIYRKIKDGTFPRLLKIGANRIAWLEREIDEWIEQLASARQEAA